MEKRTVVRAVQAKNTVCPQVVIYQQDLEWHLRKCTLLKKFKRNMGLGMHGMTREAASKF